MGTLEASVALKICAKCRRELPATAEFFYRSRQAKSGLRSWCKQCDAAHTRADRQANPEKYAARSSAYHKAHPRNRASYCRAWHAAHRAEANARARAYHEAHKEELASRKHAYYIAHRSEISARNNAYHEAHREEKAARRRSYREARPEELAVQARAFRETHQEYLAAYQRAYYKAHPAKWTAKDHKRRAAKKGNGGTHTEADIEAQRQRQNGLCYYCHKPWGSPRHPNGHIDHVVPLALGGSNGPENLVIACEECNLRKGAKHPDEFPPEPLTADATG
jgi:5-methylcytosine-specific restriction endonuclease McrA